MKDNLSNIENLLLVMASQGGNAEAFEKLVSLWQKKLWQYAFRLTSDIHAAWDITQQSWLEIIKGLKKLNNPACFKTWAYKIVTNNSIDWLKNKRKYKYTGLDSTEIDCRQKNDDFRVKNG